MTRRQRLLDCPGEVVEAAAVLLGGPVLEEVPTTGGFTPSVASIVRTAGRSAFVKAACGPQADAVRAAVTLAHVTSGLGPDLVGSAEVGPWVVAAWDVVAGQTLSGWDAAAVGRLPELVESMAAALDPAPDLGLTSFADRAADVVGTWGVLAAGVRPQGTGAHIEVGHIDAASVPTVLPLRVLAELEARWAQVMAVGPALLHEDLRADNIVRAPSGRLWVVDWTNLTSGPGWADLVMLLPDLVEYGHDGWELFSSTRWADTPAEDVLSLLAALAGYWVNAGVRPDIAHAPGLRELQRRQGRNALRLLERRLM